MGQVDPGHHGILDGGKINIKSKRQDGITKTAPMTESGRAMLVSSERRVLGSAGKSASESAESAALNRLLITMVQDELKECSLVLIHDNSKIYSAVVQTLLKFLPNARQVVMVSVDDDMGMVGWVWPKCSGYLVLLTHPHPFLNWANTKQNIWDYSGRYVVVLKDKENLDAISISTAGKNTQHMIAVVKGGRIGQWSVYTNSIYSDTGIMQSLGTWQNTRYSSQITLFPDKLADLRGIVLQISTFKFEPAIMYYYGQDGMVDYRYGVDIALVKALAHAINFKPRFSEPPDGETWGFPLRNGSWTGTFGALLRGEADIVVSNLFVSTGREEILDFTAPYKVDMTCFMTRTEPPLPRWHALAFPFHPWTWLAILFGLIVSGPVLAFVAFFSGKWGNEVSSLGNLGFSCYYALGLHTCENQVLVPRRNSTRIFVMFLWLYTMILTISYSTNLTAFLLVRKQPASMQTIQDIYNSGLELISLTDVYRDGIASSSNEYLQRLLRVYKGYTSAEGIFQRVMAGKAVYLENRRALEFQKSTCFTWRGVPRVRILKECYTTFNVAMALRRYSPLKGKFDEVIGLLQQSGLLDHYFRDSLMVAASAKDSRTCSVESSGDDEMEVLEDTDVIPLSLEHLQGIFFIVCIGWAASIISFTIEWSISQV